MGPRGSESFTLTDKIVGVSQRRWYLNWALEDSQQERKGMSRTQKQKGLQFILGTASD